LRDNFVLFKILVVVIGFKSFHIRWKRSDYLRNNKISKGIWGYANCDMGFFWVCWMKFYEGDNEHEEEEKGRR
jgi:hypothetical protein